MRRKIELTDGAERKKICKALGITSPALSMALSFKRNSPNAVRARQMALENGGILMEEKEMTGNKRLTNK